MGGAAACCATTGAAAEADIAADADAADQFPYPTDDAELAAVFDAADEAQATLKALVLRGPRLGRDGCVAWRARDLRDLVERRFGVGYSETGILRLLHGLDLSWQKARPVHPEADPKAQERFQKRGSATP